MYVLPLPSFFLKLSSQPAGRDEVLRALSFALNAFFQLAQAWCALAPSPSSTPTRYSALLSSAYYYGGFPLMLHYLFTTPFQTPIDVPYFACFHITSSVLFGREPLVAQLQGFTLLAPAYIYWDEYTHTHLLHRPGPYWPRGLLLLFRMLSTIGLCHLSIQAGRGRADDEEGGVSEDRAPRTEDDTPAATAAAASSLTLPCFRHLAQLINSSLSHQPPIVYILLLCCPYLIHIYAILSR